MCALGQAEGRPQGRGPRGGQRVEAVQVREQELVQRAEGEFRLGFDTDTAQQRPPAPLPTP
ncbi:hypothetical protein GPA10_33305 [Streptomyces sp. p1417]|uniref:Uncharacterized protein n=1 Tax=Streptomyces typhae TaxID=2681492 RepID=A0A6L6X6S0_9ACTN|nr:hypothetical protein [Streptomyces typhae]MVO89502.1 hypothetical protein [Streptomyces typhae]